MKNFKSLTMSCLFLSLVVAGCTNSLDDRDSVLSSVENVSGDDAVISYLRSLPTPTGLSKEGEGELRSLSGSQIGEPVEIEGTEVEETDDEEVIVDGVPGHWVTTTKRYKVTHAFDETLVLNPNQDMLYPACILAGNSIHDGSYRIVTQAHTKPVTVSISRVAANQDEIHLTKHSFDRDIRKSDYNEFFQQLAHLEYKDQPAAVLHSLDVVNSEKDLKSSLGASVKLPEIFDLKTNFGFDFNNKKNHILAKFIQRSFSVSVDFPKGGTILEGFSTDLFKDAQPVYVSSINYGRIVFVAIETTAKLSEVQAAINFVLKKNPKVPVDLGVDPSAHYKKVFNDSKVGYTVLGGSQGATTQMLTSPTLETLREYISSTPQTQEMLPINFQLRYVHDNSVARVVSETEYPVITRVFIPDFQAVEFRAATASVVLSGDVDHTNEIFGNCSLEGKGIEAQGVEVSKNSGMPVVKLYDRTRWNWVRLKADGSTENPFIHEKLITIKREPGERSEDFLRRRVTFRSDVWEKNPFGVFPYSATEKEMTISDIIGASQTPDQSFVVRSQNGSYICNMRFKVSDVYYRTSRAAIPARR